MSKRFIKPDKKRGSQPRSKVKTVHSRTLTRVARYGNGLYVPVLRLTARELGFAIGDDIEVRVFHGGVYAKKLSPKFAAKWRAKLEERRQAARKKARPGAFNNAKQMMLALDELKAS